MSKTKKTAPDNSGTSSGELVPQKHGGAIRRGSKPGGNENAGRPPSAIREIARKSFAERIPILERIADDDDARSSDRISAIKVLADTGGVDKLALTVEEQPEEAVTPERIADMWERLQRLKTIEQFERLLVNAAKRQQGGGDG